MTIEATNVERDLAMLHALFGQIDLVAQRIGARAYIGIHDVDREAFDAASVTDPARRVFHGYDGDPLCFWSKLIAETPSTGEDDGEPRSSMKLYTNTPPEKHDHPEWHRQHPNPDKCYACWLDHQEQKDDAA